jgi:hypothetical protein
MHIIIPHMDWQEKCSFVDDKSIWDGDVESDWCDESKSETIKQSTTYSVMDLFSGSFFLSFFLSFLSFFPYSKCMRSDVCVAYGGAVS